MIQCHRNMLHRFLVLIFVFLSAATLDPTVLVAQEAGDVAFDVRSDANFGDATVALREFLRDANIRSPRVQHFCVVGYQSSDGGDKRAWVHWTEGHEIILWSGAADPQSAKTAIVYSRRVLDLKKDVVPTEADIKGSTYLVTRAWVDGVISECQTRGAKYHFTSRSK